MCKFDVAYETRISMYLVLSLNINKLLHFSDSASRNLILYFAHAV